MQAIIFCGIQGSGKTTFYRDHFLKTHIRISLDMLNTRNKEDRFLETCFLTNQPFVVDNTNPTRIERLKYINASLPFRFQIIGYFFETTLAVAIERNSSRVGKEHIPIPGIRGTFKRLQVPQLEEGFHELYHVEAANGSFNITSL